MTEQTYVATGFPVAGWMGYRDRKRVEKGIQSCDRGFCVTTEDSHRDELFCCDKPLLLQQCLAMIGPAVYSNKALHAHDRASRAHDRASRAHDRASRAHVTALGVHDRLAQKTRQIINITTFKSIIYIPCYRK